jgi:hypothetical protein
VAVTGDVFLMLASVDNIITPFTVLGVQGMVVEQPVLCVFVFESRPHNFKVIFI